MSNSSISLSAIVLAGGQSSRMGQDKALLPVGGIPMLRRVCDAAMALTSAVYIVTPWPDRYREIVPASCQWIPEQYAPNEAPAHGPLIGFAQGLTQVQTDWVLLLACDLPYLDIAVLHRWNHSLIDAGSAIAVLAKSEKGWEPLCGFYHRRCYSSLTEFIQQGGRSFQDWLAQVEVKEIGEESDRAMLFNCNTPDDL